jgi:intracellular multiplication protein IcmK
MNIKRVLNFTLVVAVLGFGWAVSGLVETAMAAVADQGNAATPASAVASLPPAQRPSIVQQLAEQAQQQLQQQQLQRKAAPLSAAAAAASAQSTAAQAQVAASSSGGQQALGTEAVAGAASRSDNNGTSGVYNEAFTGVVNQILPMSPEQITRLRTIFNESQKAAATPPGVPPRPVTSSILISLSPQASPPVIRLGAGYISSLVFMDSTGQPWPIHAYSIGDPTAFNIQWDKKGNTLLIQAASFYKRSNLAVMLNGLDTPVMITLLSGQEVIDYRVDLRVPGLGPNATFAQSSLPDSANPVLLDVLNGIPPRGGKTLRVAGGECQAWLVENRLFIRTDLDIISPAWKAVMSSADGTHAYELQPAPVILALQKGKDKTLILTVEGFE